MKVTIFALAILICAVVSTANGDEAQDYCTSNNGLWSETTNSCFEYFHGQLTRDQAAEECAAQGSKIGKNGVKGRLPIIPTSTVYNLLKTSQKENKEQKWDKNGVWLGLKAKDPGFVNRGITLIGSFPHKDQWAFFDGSTKVGDWGFSPRVVTVQNGDGCMRMKRNGAYDDWDCSVELGGALCEFLV